MFSTQTMAILQRGLGENQLNEKNKMSSEIIERLREVRIKNFRL